MHIETEDEVKARILNTQQIMLDNAKVGKGAGQNKASVTNFADRELREKCVRMAVDSFIPCKSDNHSLVLDRARFYYEFIIDKK